MLGRLGSVLQNIYHIPELRARILFTLAVLAVYRLAAHIPTPGIDGSALSKFLLEHGGAVMGFLDTFSGGALSRVTIVALGIMPYISASIIMQLMTVVVPSLSQLAKEGDHGRRIITQYTRYLTMFIAFVQASGMAIGLEGMNNGSFVLDPGWSFRAMAVITLVGGTAFLMWMGEQITERGIGNGISLIIFSSILSGMPAAIINTYSLFNTGQIHLVVILGLLVMMAVVVAAIVFLEAGRRKLSVQYARRVVGNRVYGGQSTHIPLKINTAGVIPPIFASSLIAFPATIAGFVDVPWVKNISTMLSPGQLLYTSLYVGLIIFFAFFYTAVVLNPQDIADNMKKSGGFIPGIRPGSKTSEYIYYVLTRITFAGAIYLSVVCVIPEILISKAHLPFYFGGTSLLIVVGVGLDTAQQIETHMIQRNYEGFLRKGRVRGRHA
ncbi:MAG: preprotein translocase subunit SecY [Nitrospirota bacterium]|nr:preprotein translocase subunit SecY [Nitrospirota bacterium]